MIPSERDPATGAWRGGDLDGAGDGRGLGIAGNCIFVGHANGAGVRHAINIFKIQPEPGEAAAGQVGEIPAMVEGNQGFDDRELRSLVYKTSRGEDRYILVRNAGTNTLGRMETYRIDMNTCLPTAKSEVDGLPFAVARVLPLARSGQPQSRPRLHDELDRRRSRSRRARPEGARPHRPGGHRRRHRRDAGEAEDAGRLHAAGSRRSADRRAARRDRPLLRRPLPRFQRFEERARPGGQFSEPRAEPAALGVGDRRWRAGVRGGNDRRLLRPRLRGDRALAATRSWPPARRAAISARRSSSVNGVIDAAKLPQLANDCLHMVVNNDPGSEGVSGVERVARGQGRALSRAA